MDQCNPQQKCDSDLVAEPERLGPHNMLFLFRHQTVHGLGDADGTVRTLETMFVRDLLGGSPPAQEEQAMGRVGLLVMKKLLFAT